MQKGLEAYFLPSLGVGGKGSKQLAPRTGENLANSSAILRENGLHHTNVSAVSRCFGSTVLTKEEAVLLDPQGSFLQEICRGWGGMAALGRRRGLHSGAFFFSACFPCLNLSVPVSLTVFITQPPCANKPHMFWFFPYLLSQDKVEMSTARDSL